MKYIKIIISLLVIFLIGVFLLTFFLSQKGSKNIPIPLFSVPTPTVATSQQPIFLINTTATESANTSIAPDISFTFSRPLTESEKSIATVTLTPSITGTLLWSNDSKTAFFQLSEKLQFGTNYIGRLDYGKTYIWHFTTTADTTISIDDSQKLQGIDDENFANQQQKNQQAYPWITSLPLSTDHYYVYFDTTQLAFYATIYQPVSPADESAFQKEIKDKLQILVPNLQKYPITWSTK